MSSRSLANTQKEPPKKKVEENKNEEKNFHLFYSLTKLTSILFLPFYSNIIKAVRKERRRKTICYSVSFREMCYYVCRICVWSWRKRAENEIEETRLLILHEMDSKLYNVLRQPNAKRKREKRNPKMRKISEISFSIIHSAFIKLEKRKTKNPPRREKRRRRQAGKKVLAKVK